jgi:Putative DNA-binding domain
VFGKPIATATREDLDRLISDGISEGRHLEFKEDFPSRDSSSTTPGWTPGKPVPPSRIHPLLEELVSFANADGGVIVLGMRETNDKPSRAASLSPLPQVVELERRVRDCLNDVIEPRLPYAAVKAIQTEADGSGVLLLETQPSALGPHWVKQTRTAKVRREDRADPLSMPEIHDMVLRKARRFDEVRERQLKAAKDQLKAAKDFEPYFLDALRNFRRSASRPEGQNEKLAVSLGDPVTQFRAWAKENSYGLVGLRATLVPHQRLGIARLEDMGGLISRGQIDEDDGRRNAIPLPYDYPHQPRRVLGGIVSSKQTRTEQIELRLERDGVVELKNVRQKDTFLHVRLDTLLGAVGSVLGSYRLLRDFASVPTMPAEVDVEVLVLPALRPLISEGATEREGSPLEFRTAFPSATIADQADFDDYLNELAGDFANAGGLSASALPKYHLKLRNPI